MKTALAFSLLLFIGAAPLSGGGKIDWIRDRSLDDVLKESRATGKAVMLYFAADWDGFCTQQDAGAFSDEQVVKGSEAFLRVLIDCTDKNVYAEVQQRFQVKKLPTVYFLTGDLSLLDRVEGQGDAATFLKKFAVVVDAAAKRALFDAVIRRLENRIAMELEDSGERLQRDLRRIVRSEIQRWRTGGRPNNPPPSPTVTPPARRGAYLGIVPDDFTDAQRKELGLDPGKGLKLADVRAGGPAEKAGMKAGDILLQIGATAITDRNIGDVLAGYKSGDSVDAVVLRGQERKTLSVTFTDRK